MIREHSHSQSSEKYGQYSDLEPKRYQVITLVAENEIQFQIEEGNQTVGSQAGHLTLWIFAPAKFNPLEMGKWDFIYCLKRKI